MVKQTDIQKVQSFINKFEDNPEHFRSSLPSVIMRITSTYDCVKSICTEDKEVRDGLLLTLYNEKAKLSIVAEHLGLSEESILFSPRKHTVISFGINLKMYYSISKLYKLMKNYTQLNLEEVVLSWIIINSSAMILELLSLPGSDKELFSEDVQKVISSAKINSDHALAAVEKISELYQGENVESEEKEEIQ
jgi:hypothetical protein